MEEQKICGKCNSAVVPPYREKYCDVCADLMKRNWIAKNNAPQQQIAQPQASNKEVTMYTSYAKDIFVALTEKALPVDVEKRMELAIQMVKQAKEAFS